MRRNFLPIVGLLSLFVLGACSAERDPEDRIPETRPRSRRQPAAGRCRRTRHDELLSPFADAQIPGRRCRVTGQADSSPDRSGSATASRATRNFLPKPRNTPHGWRAYNIIKGRPRPGLHGLLQLRPADADAARPAISEEVIVEAAKSLRFALRSPHRADPFVGFRRVGLTRYDLIDNMMNLEMLFWASKHTGDPVYRDVAAPPCSRSRCRTISATDANAFHVVSYNDDGTVESRGTFQRPLRLLGVGPRTGVGPLRLHDVLPRDGRREIPETCRADRRLGGTRTIRNTPADRIPYWDYDAPNIPDAPRDASAAAVISSALFELSTMVP